LHERADGGHNQTREGVRICRGLHLRSLRLGLTGKADVVEFHPDGAGNMRPFPIEYKRGRPKPDRRDEVQLCAQALCLEEMLNVEIAGGSLFYGQPRRRTNVPFDASLRAETENLAARLHELNASRVTPKAKYEKKCDSCSLYSICLPRSTEAKSARKYLKRALAAAIADTGNEP
jgi:CRISPR-associated exonuclease Cas4